MDMLKSKNNFLFILLISIVTLIALVVGAISLYKDNSLTFSSDGYIIETTSKTSTKYYFSANTKYKENVDEMITFSDVDDEKRAVDPASFVHYSNGDVMFLKKGALVNLVDLSSPMVNYYNITNLTTINYDNGNYVVSSNDKKIRIESFVGRISDNKYLISGKNLRLKVPSGVEEISGDYFELLFIEDGVLKISSEKADYQVTAQGSYIYVGDNIVINLGDGKISLDGEVKMLLSQITINGDENINLDVDNDKNSGAFGNGSGGTGEGTGNGTGEGTGDGTGDGTGNGTGEGTGDGTGEGTGEGTGVGGGSGNGTSVSESPQLELIEANVTSTSIDLTMQLNNADKVNGNLLYYFTNLSSGSREGNSKYIDLVNGTFLISQESLSPNTEYSFSIVEVGSESEKQYFQKTFRTSDLGITLEKIYTTESSLSYNIKFDENTEVSKVRISIYDDNGSNEHISNNQFIISRDEIDNNFVFEGLKSNTTYSVSVDMVWIDNAAYSDVYSINRLDSTLKKTPVISGVAVSANSEEVKFDIKLNNVKDPDKAIVSYVYNIYLADDITVDNFDPKVQYSVTKSDSDNLVLNLNEIDELKTGVDYRAKIYALYDDNEMIREVSTDYSGNFLIKSKPSISFELESATMSEIKGKISLIDANCTVPMRGRSCSNLDNTFTLRYYRLDGEETTENDTLITFDPKNLTSQLHLTDLISNTTYAVKVFGNYFDDDNQLHSNVQLGNTFYVTTDKSPNIYFEVVGNNRSGYDKNGNENSSNVVTFDARLTAPQNSNGQDEIANEINSITFNLYSGRYNVNDKRIGTYTITNKSNISDLFNNITIINNLFDDVTDKKVGKIDSLEKLIRVTNNSTNTLNGSYTVEINGVYDSGEKMIIENNVYTFNLTSSYYLDARIATNPYDNYITVTPITKESLRGSGEDPSDEYIELEKKVSNLDELNDDTVVGLIIENSLSDIFVDSAFDYEKVVVDYIICNNTLRKCDEGISKLVDNDPDNDSDVENIMKIISVDMGNKYQPKEQIVYLDSSSYTDYNKYFIRGYNYKIGFNLKFVTEEGDNPIYTNDKLYKNVSIERQDPIFTQYISNSDDNGITYRYTFYDIDSAIYNNNFYYTLGDDKENYYNIDNSLVVDNDYHDVVVPIGDNSRYTLYYARKNTMDQLKYVEMDTYDFEKEVRYEVDDYYELIDSNNKIRIKLFNNDVNARSHVYKVVIKDKSGKENDYIRYFLASKLNSYSHGTGIYGTDGEEIMENYRYIDIDYANISKFMGSNIIVDVYAYYDSGLVGINQKIDYGFVLKSSDNKYLNVFNAGVNVDSSTNVSDYNMGLYLFKKNYKKDSTEMFVYNKLIIASYDAYNPYIGATYFSTNDLSDNIGINFKLGFTRGGIVFNDSKNTYNLRVLKEAKINKSSMEYRFNAIVPTVTVKTDNTINSLGINIGLGGIYGNKQFIRNGVSHNKIYVDIYKDKDLTDRVNKDEEILKDINITGSDDKGYTASVDGIVIYSNLLPDTTYYFTISAYIDGKKVRLYDGESNTYEVKNYETKTLDAGGVLKNFNFSVSHHSYNRNSIVNDKSINWLLNFDNMKNFKIRFELFRQDGSTDFTDPDTGDVTTVINYKSVKFDGSDASSCDINAIADSSNGYITSDGCYISVDKDSISNINNKNIKYIFNNEAFVYGGGYYKLVVYAIPYNNGKYYEDKKLVLHQADNLSTTGTVNGNGYQYNISMPELSLPTFSLGTSLTSGHGQNGFYVSLKPTVTDSYGVIQKGEYTITLRNEKDEVVGEVSNSVTNLGKSFIFDNLSGNTLYRVEISYKTYRNNNGYSDGDKIMTTSFTDFIYTPFSGDITIGNITARQEASTVISLIYNGSVNLKDKIGKVAYTISLVGGSSSVSGEFVSGVNLEFDVSSSLTPKLRIDTSGTGFAFKSGNTYLITTHYYDKDGNLLMDEETSKFAFTTMLNL